MRLALVLTLTSTPLLAQVQVPFECQALAQKHGYVEVLTERQARNAILKLRALAFIKRRDPEVQACANAVRQMSGPRR